MKRLNLILCLVCTLSISSAARGADIRTVAISGRQAAGAPDGTIFTGFFEPPVLNDAGQTAFQADGYGVWSEGSGSLALVARAGDHAPGEPKGVNIRSVGYHVPTLGAPTLESPDKSGLATCCGRRPGTRHTSSVPGARDRPTTPPAWKGEC